MRVPTGMGRRRGGERPGPLRRGLLAGALVAAALLALPGTALAQRAWVKGEVKLNLRTGPGTQFRIVGTVETGDEVRVIERGDDWTHVRTNGEDKDGWIPGGYLQDEPPPAVRLSQLETELERLRKEFGDTSSEAEKLREANATLASRDGEQRQEIDKLTQENLEMRAGARVPELITGASILAMGMIVGALLHRSATRSRPTRIRL
jgi:SH3 domain protein